MGRDDKDRTPDTALIASARDYFKNIVSHAFEQRKIKTFPMAKDYVVDLLEHYVSSQNFFDDYDASGKRVRETLAIMFLKAENSEPRARTELLKKLGDRTLYISGFFSDSLHRKVVDVDYYAEMGGTAYSALASSVKEDTIAQVYKELSNRFLQFADVLTYIAAQAQIHDEANLMRLFEMYERTGSEYARSRLLDRGLIAAPQQGAFRKKQ